MAGTVRKIDLASQVLARDPFPTYAGFREARPVFRTRLPLLGKTWVATTHQAAGEVLKDDKAFVMEPKKAGRTFFGGAWRLLPRLLRVFSDNMLRPDNPDHRRLRRLVDQAFSRHSVDSLRGRIGLLCDDLLAGLGGRETMTCWKSGPGPCPWRSSASCSRISRNLGLGDGKYPKLVLRLLQAKDGEPLRAALWGWLPRILPGEADA